MPPSLRAALAALALLFGAASACYGAEPSAASDAGTAPTFAGKLIDGSQVALSDYRGRVVLVNVWASWCLPCKQELPELARLHRKYERRGFLVLSVNTDTDAKDAVVREMVEELDLPFPVVRDSAMASAPAFAVDGYPTSLLLDRDGDPVWRRMGMILRDDPELVQAIERELARTPT